MATSRLKLDSASKQYAVTLSVASLYIPGIENVFRAYPNICSLPEETNIKLEGYLQAGFKHYTDDHWLLVIDKALRQGIAISIFLDNPLMQKAQLILVDRLLDQNEATETIGTIIKNPWLTEFSSFIGIKGQNWVMDCLMRLHLGTDSLYQLLVAINQLKLSEESMLEIIRACHCIVKTIDHVLKIDSKLISRVQARQAWLEKYLNELLADLPRLPLKAWPEAMIDLITILATYMTDPIDRGFRLFSIKKKQLTPLDEISNALMKIVRLLPGVPFSLEDELEEYRPYC